MTMGEGNLVTPSGVDIAKELTLALIGAGGLAAEDMQASLQEIHACLMQLKAKEEARAGGVGPEPAARAGEANWRKSITKHAITCLECGVSFKQLSSRHFRQHGMDSRSYRDKYGIPRSQSLAAKETTARRKQIVQENRPWEKTATYLQSQGQHHGAAVKRADQPTSSARSTRRKAASKKAADRRR
jgi:predicted transcriptional regulator